MHRKKAYRIEYLRPACIQCKACAKLNPQFWSIDEKDGRADLKGAKIEKNKEGRVLKETLEIEEIQGNHIVAEACPIKCINVYDQESGKRIIIDPKDYKSPKKAN
ncbi:MAG: ferredoxin [Candidatus Blackburnbacteria bacterium]|nr:ferredoxin [Candidatus Blackburnbacteria bacterium]